MCGCEFNVAGAGGTIAGAVHGHFSSRSDISAIYHSALVLWKMLKLMRFFHLYCAPFPSGKTNVFIMIRRLWFCVCCYSWSSTPSPCSSTTGAGTTETSTSQLSFTQHKRTLGRTVKRKLSLQQVGRHYRACHIQHIVLPHCLWVLTIWNELTSFGINQYLWFWT